MSWNIKTPGDYINGPLTVAGAATITGNLTVDTNTLFVNSTTDRVGIATASPAEKLTIDNTLGAGAIGLRVFANDQSTARMGVHNTNGQSWQFVAGYAGANNQGLSIFDATTSANRLYLDTSGNANIINGNLILGTSGKGIDFTAAGNATGMTSELLNDYEEGTFTVGIAFGGASVDVVYAQQIGIYTKVGRIVHFSGRVDLSNKGSSTGHATITGLPFNANLGAVSVGYQLSAAPSGAQVMLTISSTVLTIRYATGTTTAESTDANFANNSIIIFGGTYAV